MLDNIMIGRYYPIKSKIHKMNPISKIICLIVYLIAVFFAHSLIMTSILLAFTIVLASLSHINFKIYLKTVLSLKYLFIFIILINLIFKINIVISLIMIIRLSMLVIYTSILTLTTPPTEITYGLEKVFSFLKIIKVPVNKMALSLTLAIRFIPTIIDQANKILKSQASRGIDFYTSNIKGKYIALKSMMFPMINLTFKKADDLADAMEVRLFSIYNKRTNYRINKWELFDTYILFLHIVIVALIIVKEVII